MTMLVEELLVTAAKFASCEITEAVQIAEARSIVAAHKGC
jgi:hypothetical protein